MLNLIKLKKFPSKFLLEDREYVKLTRPEDIEEYDYISSLTPETKIDFSKFDGGSYDVTWEGRNYILPILQREYLYHRGFAVVNFLDDFIWRLTYEDGIKKLAKLLDNEDITCLKEWFYFLLCDESTPSQITYYENEILGFINYLKTLEG